MPPTGYSAANPGTSRAWRYPIETTVRYRRAGSDRWLEGRTVNVSTSGVLFKAPPPCLPTELVIDLRLELSTLGPGSADIACSGRIVRVMPARHGDGFALMAATIEKYSFSPASRPV